MQLERLCLDLRRRTPWEALDLGLVVLRHWYRPVYRAWFATVLPFALIVSILLWQWPGVAVIVVWWLKPLFDRVLLKVYAEASFGTPPSVKDVWRALPGLVRNSGLLRGLTVGRFSLARSFHLPVVQLEGQRGREAAARRRVLDSRTRGSAVWLTYVCAHFSAFLQISLILAIELLRPQEVAPFFDWAALFRGESEPWLEVLTDLAYVAGESLVEPFYVAAGFTLYLNRRNELEGWDIELGFRRLSRRIEAESEGRGKTARKAALLAVFLCFAGFSWLQAPREAFADPPAASVAETGEAKRAIREVLADPVFGRQVEEWGWRYRDSKKESRKHDSDILKMLATIGEWMAKGFRGFSFAAAAVLVTALIVLLYRYHEKWLIRSPAARRVPETLFGLDVRPESLPTDPVAAARRHLAAGEHAAALSLLYRGALVSLIHRAYVDFRPGDTEGNCLERVRGRIDAAGESYFAELLQAWKLTAYAGAAPPVAQLSDLCTRWPEHFAG
ncbi:uncharacterized protein sS8_3955 [Methylocaldum marinum]|uniref:Uncharacterized protein n=1 Tax=Methylocaldum marinum TaxID=1432792 RepID=A0A250KW91_9GAMM|nr:DUF4129 domain-containing protein [Methylocaldum marinum]BBA35887.1 uncharacterized protein sS8_3955 [Methylocaldum marinum]